MSKPWEIKYFQLWVYYDKSNGKFYFEATNSANSIGDQTPKERPDN